MSDARLVTFLSGRRTVFGIRWYGLKLIAFVFRTFLSRNVNFLTITALEQNVKKYKN